MPKPKDTLDRIKINTPCTANWDEMVGNDQVRFCEHCNLSVHDLSTMTRQEALRLVIRSNGKLCARYERRPDGVMRTTDLVLPKLHSISRRASRIAAGAFSAALSLSTSVVAAAPARAGANAASTAGSTYLASRARARILGASGGNITGVVKDVAGAVIPGITVTLINEATGGEYSTTTDEEGLFSFYSIEEGSFKLKTEGSGGFAGHETTNITVRANDEQNIGITLEVASMALGGAIAFSAPSEPLVSAVVEGDVATVKELLATGTDVNVLDEDYGTALSQAIPNSNREIVDILINAGADVNKATERGHIALMSISPSTTSDIVWALIDAGAKTDLRDQDGKSALHYASSSSNPEAVRALLEAGASVDARDQGDRTALMIAAEAGSTETVLVLLKAGASVNLRDEDGTTALGKALEHEYAETAKVLLEFGATE